VNVSAEELGQICLKTSDAAKDIVSATHEQSVNMHKMAYSSQNLYLIASNIHEQVAKFSIH
jgi:methyl-accepting chemotaxis protein